MPRVFFSYSHKDEELRDRLETHLAMLKRENIVETWHDRRITAGDEWKGQIDSNLESADVVLLLVSADFLNSYYCYDVELQRALELHNEGKSKVIPVILKHCDWKSAPFSKLQAAPKDGKPIVSWTDLDEAFLNVVQMLRDSLKKVTKNSLADKSNSVDRNTSALTSATNLSTSLNYTTEPRSSNLRVSKAFTEAETDKFI